MLNIAIMALAASVAFTASNASAGESWASFPVYNFDRGKAVESTISPTASSSKKWSLCAILPHMKGRILAFGGLWLG